MQSAHLIKLDLRIRFDYGGECVRDHDHAQQVTHKKIGCRTFPSSLLYSLVCFVVFSIFCSLVIVELRKIKLLQPILQKDKVNTNTWKCDSPASRQKIMNKLLL